MGIPAPLGIAASGLPNTGDQANSVLSGTFSAVGPGRCFAFRGPMNFALWASINTTLTTTNASLSATVGSATGLTAGAAINSVNVPPGTTIGVLSGTTVTLALPVLSLQGSINALGQISGLESTAGLLGATVTIPSTREGITLPVGTTVLSILTTAVAENINGPGTKGVVQLSTVPTVLPNQSGQSPFDFAVTSNAVTTGVDTAALFTGAGVVFSATVQLEWSFDGGSTWLPCNIGGGGTLAQYGAGTPVRVTFGEPERNILYRPNCLTYVSGTINYRISTTGAAAESLAISSSI